MKAIFVKAAATKLFEREVVPQMRELMKMDKFDAIVAETACAVLSMILGETEKGETPASRKNSAAAEENSMTQIVRDLKDPLVPVRGHALIRLARLIQDEPPKRRGNSEELFALIVGEIFAKKYFAMNGIVVL